MKKLFASIFKLVFIFLVIVGIFIFIGSQFRRYTLPFERVFQPKVDKFLIMVHLKEDTTRVGVPIDTLLTAEEELALAIKTRMESLDSLEQILSVREDSLNLQRSRLESDRADLTARQTELTDTEDENLTKLAKLYGQMKPKEAAQILLQLPDQTAVEILYRMNDREAGKLIEALGDPVRAADIISRYRRLQSIIKKID